MGLSSPPLPRSTCFPSTPLPCLRPILQTGNRPRSQIIFYSALFRGVGRGKGAGLGAGSPPRGRKQWSGGSPLSCSAQSAGGFSLEVSLGAPPLVVGLWGPVLSVLGGGGGSRTG